MSRNGRGAGHGPTAMQPSDAFFWHAEAATPELRPLVAGLFMLDRHPQPARLRAALRRLVALAPRLRQRVIEPALGLGLPLWEDDAAFDLDYHLRSVALPGAGSQAALLRYAGEVFSAPLDHLRPLWEAHVVEGLAGGRAAFFLKLHHAVLDGAGSVALFDGLTQARRNDPIRVPNAAVPARLGAPVPGPARAARALAAAAEALGTLADPAALAERLTRLARGAAGLVGEIGRASDTPAWHGGGAGIGRRLAVLDASMTRLRRIKDAHGATLNDVVLTAVAGAIGAAEARRGGAPDELHCMVPMSLRAADERSALGNRVGGFTVALPIAERDAAARLAAIRAQTTRAKSDGHGSAFKTMMQLAAYVPPALFRAAAQSASGRIHLLCSNVPGPTVGRCLAGARITAVYPFAPVMRGTPLSIALMSYGDSLGIGIDTDPEAIAAPARLATLLGREFAALEKALPRRRGRRPASAPA